MTRIYITKIKEQFLGSSIILFIHYHRPLQTIVKCVIRTFFFELCKIHLLCFIIILYCSKTRVKTQAVFIKRRFRLPSIIVLNKGRCQKKEFGEDNVTICYKKQSTDEHANYDIGKMSDIDNLMLPI